MQLTGEYDLPAPPTKVWELLHDETTLLQCLPGLQELEKTSEKTFSARSKVKIGPVSASFTGTVELFDMTFPSSYSIRGEGKSGAAGFAKGSATIELKETDKGGTLLRYMGDAKVGGKLAQLGARLVSASAKKTADDFFSTLCNLIAAEANSPDEDVREASIKSAIQSGTASGKENRMTGNDQGHGKPAGGITTEPVEVDDSDIGAGAELGVWVTALLCVVLLLLAIFAL
ncbi:MAG: carbon monoxide dehydrogenase subunit G [Kiloniellales bacterium]|nr:carbon monoxide dehydrogenase subunit G [Kiloniellales bacterium]